MAAKLVLTRPKLVFDTRCPKCNGFNILALSSFDIECSTCHKKSKTNAQVNIYFSIAKKLISLVSNNDETIIIGERDDSIAINSKDLIKPKSQHEDDIYHTMLAIHHDFTKQKCWEVSEIINDTEIELKKECHQCGFCNNCVTCSDCDNVYPPIEIKAKTHTKKIYRCPRCKSKNYKKTYLKESETECPHCNSKEIKRTQFYSDKLICPKCGIKTTMKPKNISVYKLTINRQERNKM